MKLKNIFFKKIVAISLGFTTMLLITNTYAGPGNPSTQSAFKLIPKTYIQKISDSEIWLLYPSDAELRDIYIPQTESKDSKSIKSPIPEEERAKGKHRKPKWNVTSNANQIIFNGIKNSIANNNAVIVSKKGDNNFIFTIGDTKSYFEIIGTVTGFKTSATGRNKENIPNIPIVSWNLINKDDSMQEIKINTGTYQKYIHFDGNEYSASTDKNDYRFIFCQRCATRCIQKLLGKNVEITYTENGNIVSCPIKFNEDYREKFADKAKTYKALSCQDCNGLNNLKHQ